jgi:predicted nucleic acid-binding protein
VADATALQHGLTMVTRNLKDFAVPELLVLDPWLG